ncbi:MAG: hypothetical protein CMP25_01055 [Rickettsiales bacterium]|nr:hypothetical protein [Rickettsiales bacterium]
MKKKIFIFSFHKFITVVNKSNLKKKLLNVMKTNSIFGTILIADEGINGAISGDLDNLEKLKSLILDNVCLNINFKKYTCSNYPFIRKKVKIKNEIVKMGVHHVDVQKFTAQFLEPKEWEVFLKKEDTVVVDTRNTYESEIGNFKNSISTNTSSFSEFPKWVEKNKKNLKNKVIAMYCTGGIRCEKASSYMIEKGFKNIYQLKGGILNYLKVTEKKNSLWNGECFVFDDRVSVNHSLKKGKFIQCFACKSALTKEDTFSKYYKKGISCNKCYKKTTSKQKERFKERIKQISIAKKKKIMHLGKKNINSQ